MLLLGEELCNVCVFRCPLSLLNKYVHTSTVSWRLARSVLNGLLKPDEIDQTLLSHLHIA